MQPTASPARQAYRGVAVDGAVGLSCLHGEGRRGVDESTIIR